MINALLLLLFPSSHSLCFQVPSMASSLLHLFFLLLLLSVSSSIALKPDDPDSLILPITKDTHTHQYLTQIHLRTPHVPASLVIDLGGRFLWLDCHSGYVSTTYRSVQCRSVQCSTAKSTHCGGAHHLSCPDKHGGCAQNSCVLFPHNTITNTYSIAELVEDVVAVRSKDGSITTVDDFLFSCAPKFLLRNLAVGVEGMAGLGRNRIALPSQLAGKLGFHRKFTVCLPSSSSISNGFIFFGDGPYTDVSKSLLSTPIVIDASSNTEFDRSNEYYIGVKSIKVNGVRLSFNSSILSIDKSGFGGTKLSTLVPYTTLETSIYNSLTQAFIEIASSTSFNMTRVASIAPFEVCFSSENIDEMRHGPVVPVIDLGLQSELVNWRIYGSNSMVRVNDEVMCLGFLNGGLNPRSSIVIGGYQMEDNLLEFDLGTSMLGFSSSLLIKDIKCSDFKFDDQESRGSL